MFATLVRHTVTLAIIAFIFFIGYATGYVSNGAAKTIYVAPMPEQQYYEEPPAETPVEVFLPSWVENSTEEEMECLAKNMYHEAKGEGLEGWLAVANVTLNRVRSNKYPNTICKVVYQNRQFSWTQDGLSDDPKNHKIWNRIVAIAGNMTAEGDFDRVEDNTNGATHFHATRITPYWVADMTPVNTIGNHAFYRGY